MAKILTLDVEVYDDYGGPRWAQARFLVHGSDDVLWTNSVDSAVKYLETELRRAEQNILEREDVAAWGS